MLFQCLPQWQLGVHEIAVTVYKVWDLDKAFHTKSPSNSRGSLTCTCVVNNTKFAGRTWILYLYSIRGKYYTLPRAFMLNFFNNTIS